MGSPLPRHKPRELTQAEEIAYWQGYDAGRAKGAIYCESRYTDDGLSLAYVQGWDDGQKKQLGLPWDPDADCPYRPKGAQSVAT